QRRFHGFRLVRRRPPRPTVQHDGESLIAAGLLLRGDRYAHEPRRHSRGTHKPPPIGEIRNHDETSWIKHLIEQKVTKETKEGKDCCPASFPSSPLVPSCLSFRAAQLFEHRRQIRRERRKEFYRLAARWMGQFDP